MKIEEMNIRLQIKRIKKKFQIKMGGGNLMFL